MNDQGTFEPERITDPAATTFLDNVRYWAIATKDPRVHAENEKYVMTDLPGLCAAFCGFMARVCDAGYESKDWPKAFMAGVR